MHELVSPSINFGILVFALVYFLRKPVKLAVSSRHDLIKKQVEDARLQKIEADKKYAEFSARIDGFDKEAKEILERAHTEAQALKEKIIRDAEASAERIVKEAETTVQANVQEYKDRIRKETIAASIEMAEKIIRDRLSSDDQKRMVNEYVGKVQ